MADSIGGRYVHWDSGELEFSAKSSNRNLSFDFNFVTIAKPTVGFACDRVSGGCRPR